MPSLQGACTITTVSNDSGTTEAGAETGSEAEQETGSEAAADVGNGPDSSTSEGGGSHGAGPDGAASALGFTPSNVDLKRRARLPPDDDLLLFRSLRFQVRSCGAMRLAMIGLGKMGSNMTLRLMGGGHEVVAFDANPEIAHELGDKRALVAVSLANAVAQLNPPRVAWVMVPAHVTEKVVDELRGLLSKGDVVVDGGNSNWKESRRRADVLGQKGVLFCDAGTSGGVWGLKNGYCLMVGGAPEAVNLCDPIFKTLAPEGGYAHVGPAGAGHYVKMVHNGIEYGLMQAYAEGFEILKTAPFGLDLPRIAGIWGHGSVVRSWLLELVAAALKDDPQLAKIKGWVEDSGEGRWTVQASIDQNVPAPVITLALQTRFRSRQDESFSAKLLAALRNQFGGHAVKKATIP